MQPQLQTWPTPSTWFPHVLGTDLIPIGAEYDAGGEFTLSVFAGRRYLWVGIGEEGCSNDGNSETSNEPFTAASNSLLLTGPAEELITATVQEVLR